MDAWVLHIVFHFCLGLIYSMSLLSGSYRQHDTLFGALYTLRHYFLRSFIQYVTLFWHLTYITTHFLGPADSTSLFSGSYIQYVSFLWVLYTVRHFFWVLYTVRHFFIETYRWYVTFYKVSQIVRQFFFQGLTYTTEISSGSYIQYITHSRDTVILSHLGDVIYGWFVRKLRPLNFICSLLLHQRSSSSVLYH